MIPTTKGGGVEPGAIRRVQIGATTGDMSAGDPSGRIPVEQKGTPPGDMNPLTEDEWWSICRDEDAPGIPHEGPIAGCMECFYMCAAHPAANDPQDSLTCFNKAILQCVLPELGEMFQRVPPNTCQPWSRFDSDTWESTSCKDPVACSNECQRLCREEGFGSGRCETAGDLYFCSCE
jgi:hypothetical protein